MPTDSSSVGQGTRPRPTYINFSRPQPSVMGPKGVPARRTSPGLESVDENGELRSYKPIKPARFLHFRVTSNDLNAHAQDAEAKRDDRALEQQTTIGERILPLSERTSPTSSHDLDIMPSSSQSQSWHKKYQAKKAGSYNFGEIPTLTKTPWEMHRGEAVARKTRPGSGHSSSLPARIFQQLPQEIYQCVLDQLEKAHSTGPMLDLAGLHIDLRTLCRVDKKWNRVAREHMYRDLWLPGNAQPKKKKFSFQSPKSRLQMLLETLRKSPFLATLVLRLRVSTQLAAELDVEIPRKVAKSPTLQTLVEIVELCPNLEHVDGYIPSVGPGSLCLINMLSTRLYLKSHAWNLNASRAELPTLGEFISLHDKWTYLDTLVLSANKGVDLGLGSISSVLQRLPGLSNLMLSGIHPADFNDATLFTLPRLKSLRLQNLAGLTDQGVEQLAFSPLATSLQRLALIGLELLSLQTVQTLLSHLTRLRRFVCIQESSPEPLMGVDASGKELVLASQSLRHLHWDCVMLGTATSSFADAIAEGRFPRLRSVKIPCDYDGLIQAICRPIPQVRLTPEDQELLATSQDAKAGRSMRIARLQAQQRTQQRPVVNVVVQDETEAVRHHRVFGSFLGDVQSAIEYQIDPEFGDHPITEFADVSRPNASLRANMDLQQKLDLGLLF